MDAGEVLALQRPAHRAFYRLFDGASPGARVVERDDGVLVCTCPARPERSLVNAVLYDNSDTVVRALPELAEEFAASAAHATAGPPAPAPAVARSPTAGSASANATDR